MNTDCGELLAYMKERPALYAPSTHPFWDDEHVSQCMLESHLDPNTDGASRKLGFIRQSVDWITEELGGGGGKRLLDLGCGPGLYASLLDKKGFRMTGVDLSRRSIAYAVETARANGQNIEYMCQNYLTIDFHEEFDAAILVYCDFGVLSPADRQTLLQNIRHALKPGGALILDAWNTPYLRSYVQQDTVRYQNGGFWSPKPYAVIERDMLYKETGNTLEQHLIVSETDLRCYNIWNQAFTKDALSAEMARAGFGRFAFYDDVAGAPFTGQKETFCVAARR